MNFGTNLKYERTDKPNNIDEPNEYDEILLEAADVDEDEETLLEIAQDEDEEIYRNPNVHDIFSCNCEYLFENDRDFRLNTSRSSGLSELILRPSEPFAEIRGLVVGDIDEERFDIVEGFILVEGIINPIQHCWLANLMNRTYIDPIMHLEGIDEQCVHYFPGIYIPDSTYNFMDKSLIVGNEPLYPLLTSKALDTGILMNKALISCLRYSIERASIGLAEPLILRELTEDEMWAHVLPLDRSGLNFNRLIEELCISRP